MLNAGFCNKRCTAMQLEIEQTEIHIKTFNDYCQQILHNSNKKRTETNRNVIEL